MFQPLVSLHPKEFEHPFDFATLSALQSIPGFDSLVRQLVSQGLERSYRIRFAGSNLRITSKNYPQIHDVLEDTVRRLGFAVIPELYVQWGEEISAFTLGSAKPLIVLSSACIDRLSEQELRFVIGHELGHVICEHVVYRLVAISLFSVGAGMAEATGGSISDRLAGVIESFPLLGQCITGIGKILTWPMRSTLLRWYRMSEFTADRAGLLAVQDMDSALTVMVKLAGLPESLNGSICLSEFIEQAKQFESLDLETINKWMKIILHAGETHPWTVVRAAELLKWRDSGEYQAVLNRETRDRPHKTIINGQAFCRICSFRLDGSEVFCPNCGQELLPQISAVKQ